MLSNVLSTPVPSRSGAQALFRNHGLFIITAFVAGMPMAIIAYRLFGISPSAYLPLAPLGILLLFRRRRNEQAQLNGKIPLPMFLAPGTIFLVAGLYLGRPSLVWMGSYWNLLAVFALHGMGLAFPAPLLIFAVPPLASFLSLVAGFSLRIWLSSVVAATLRWIDPTAMAAGNIIFFHGEASIVERACEGMKMATTSFLLATVLFRFSSRAGRWLIALSVFPLWLFANMVRITALVLFHIPARSPGHEIVGLALFGGMILFPLLAFSLSFPGSATSIEQKKGNSRPKPFLPSSFRTSPLVFSLLIVLSLVSIAYPPQVRSSELPWPSTILGFQKEPPGLDPSVAIYRDGSESLIIKQNLFAPGTAHDPRVCFGAIGFSFRNETMEKIGPYRVRSALVEKSGKPARLLWWYAWNDVRSPSDVRWRLARLRGSPVFQMNLYGPDEKSLRQRAYTLLNSISPEKWN